ncbi:MAG: efflux RND transporter periplasmic adaptor subunit [Pseudomonadota bacterium]
MILPLAMLVAGCSGGDKPPAKAAQRPPAPVSLGQAITKKVPVTLLAIGRVEALATVSVRSQASGLLQKVHFAEGQMVKMGDRLFTIDPRTYQTALDQAIANLERDQAQLKENRQEAERNRQMVKRNFVSVQDYEKAVATAESQAATVKADEAAVEKARLELSYCNIDSPLTGETGSLLINQGNLIQAGSDTLVTIKQIQPCYVSFSMPERDLPQIRAHQAKGRLVVQASLPGVNAGAWSGDLTFIDNQVDAKTGTVTLKGTFANADAGLWPGQFVNVTLELYTMDQAVTVPTRAIQNGPQGTLVFVVKDDMTVDARAVQLGPVADMETVVNEGVKSGEKVVIDGQLALYPGAKVFVSDGKPSAPAAAKPEAK